MEIDTKPDHYIAAQGYAYYRLGDDLACAPLLQEGGVDWDGWTLVEECPDAEKAEMQTILKELNFDDGTAASVMKRIGWY